jgi:glycine/D-amino acid oxidase-like deaminating enzyme
VPYLDASSTDVSKGIRRTWYAGDNETYVDLVEQAAKRWREWEERFNTKFYHQVGGIIVLDNLETGTPMHASVEFLRARGADVEVLAASEAQKRFPQFRLADHQICVRDPWAEYIESGRAVSFMARLAREEGVTLREHSPVSVVEEQSTRVDVVHGTERATFDRVVVAAGAWVGRLLPEIGSQVRVTHQEMLLIEPSEPARFAAGPMPVWGVDPDGEGWYGFPMLREGYAKISKEPLGETADPDMDRAGTEGFAEQTLAFLEERIPELARGRIVGGRSCLYTATPDDHFMVDWAPERSRVLVAGGGSGHGFKFGASIGPVIADAVEDRPNSLGDRFRIGDRFKPAASPGPQDSRGFARPTSAR